MKTIIKITTFVTCSFFVFLGVHAQYNTTKEYIMVSNKTASFEAVLDDFVGAGFSEAYKKAIFNYQCLYALSKTKEHFQGFSDLIHSVKNYVGDPYCKVKFNNPIVPSEAQKAECVQEIMSKLQTLMVNATIQYQSRLEAFKQSVPSMSQSEKQRKEQQLILEIETFKNRYAEFTYSVKISGQDYNCVRRYGSNSSDCSPVIEVAVE